MTELRTTTVNYDEFTSLDFVPPATYYIRIATGDYIFLHTSKRGTAQEWVDENFPPKGKYRVAASKLTKNKSDVTARG